MKILILVSTLSRGGAERTAANISKALSTKFPTTIMTFHGLATYPYGGKLIDCGFPYDPDADLYQKPLRLYRKSVAFRRVLSQENPDVVLSFSEGANLVALLNRDSRRRYVINTQTLPSRIYKGLNKFIYTPLIRRLYPRAESLIALSEGVKADLEDHFGVPGAKINVIYNPVDCEEVRAAAEERVNESIFEEGVPVVLTTGRLVALKNHSLLIRAFAQAREQIPSKLVLLGEGPMEQELHRLAANLGIEKHVRFLGWRSNPFQYMRRSSLFVLTSNYEGFGNVLVEAMACGCPVISTDCPSGPREILQDGKYGILVPLENEAKLVEAMNTALTHEALRSSLAAAGLQRARDFDLPVIAKQYEEVLLGPGDSHQRPTG